MRKFESILSTNVSFADGRRGLIIGDDFSFGGGVSIFVGGSLNSF
jgi:hypothetical protein